VAFFANVKASSVCIHLSCLLCIQPVVHGEHYRPQGRRTIGRRKKRWREQL